jgi:nitrite reductase/ring-hydroxylating ferredoxin subunit
MHYVRIADTAELAPGQMKRFQAEGHEVLLANIEGEFYAIADRCTHQGGSLCQGSLVSGVVQCLRHGARFDVKTGLALLSSRTSVSVDFSQPISDQPESRLRRFRW